MPKVEFDSSELGKTAYEGYRPDRDPGYCYSWEELFPSERELWTRAGIAVVKLFARRVDELMDKIEAEKTAGLTQ